MASRLGYEPPKRFGSGAGCTAWHCGGAQRCLGRVPVARSSPSTLSAGVRTTKARALRGSGHVPKRIAIASRALSASNMSGFARCLRPSKVVPLDYERSNPDNLPGSIRGPEFRSQGFEDRFALFHRPTLPKGLPNQGGIFHGCFRPIGPQPSPDPRTFAGFGAVASSFRPFSFPPRRCHFRIVPRIRTTRHFVQFGSSG